MTEPRTDQARIAAIGVLQRMTKRTREIPPRAAMVLLHLAGAAAAPRSKHAATALGFNAPQMCRAMDALEALKLADRTRPQPNDPRIVLLCISDEGRQVARDLIGAEGA